MEVKTDTKEKFHVIRVKAPVLSANMAAELDLEFASHLKASIKNIVVNFSGVDAVEEEAAEVLVRSQQKFYEAGASFVLCELKADVEDFLDQKELLEMLNVTPTESEAWDIVQMEEMERDILGSDFDD